MIYGIGTDIVAHRRIKKVLLRFPKRILQKLLSVEELSDFQNTAYPERFIAKRFAAKEALLKALGTGVSRNLRFHEITITHDVKGKPLFQDTDKLKKLFQKRGIFAAHLSISDETEYAIAFVVLEG